MGMKKFVELINAIGILEYMHEGRFYRVEEDGQYYIVERAPGVNFINMYDKSRFKEVEVFKYVRMRKEFPRYMGDLCNGREIYAVTAQRNGYIMLIDKKGKRYTVKEKYFEEYREEEKMKEKVEMVYIGKSENGFKKGKIYVVTMEPDGSYLLTDDDGDIRVRPKREFREKNKIDLLENGGMVRLRNDRLYYVFKNNSEYFFFANEKKRINGERYNEDMKEIFTSAYDVMEIMRPKNVNSSLEYTDQYLVWEREEFVEMTVKEIEEKLGVENLKIVKE